MRKQRGWAGAFALAIAATLSSAWALADLNISVSLKGLEDKELRSEMRGLSRVAGGKQSYTALAPLRSATNRDATSIHKALVSKGYYAATVAPNIVRTGLDVDVTFEITPGPKFEITEYVIEYTDERAANRPRSFDDIGRDPHGSPDGERLKSLETRLITHLWNNGYPGARRVKQEVRANFSTGTAVAVYQIESGPLAHYGDIRVNGLEKTDPDFVRAHFNPSGDGIYRRKEVDSFRTSLAATSLFREISIQPAEPEADGRTDLVVDITERKHRTIGAGLSFSTDVGAGATASWENRNLFGHGELLSTELKFSAPEQQFELVFDKPLPRLPGSWTSSLLLENETTDAFEAQTFTIGTGIQKLFLDRKLETGVGIRYTYSDITDYSDPDFPDGVDETAQTVSFPLAAAYNNENDPLNPTSGFRVRAEVTPYFGDLQFNRAELSGATRYGFGQNKRFLIAGRARMGASIGASGTDLPATERFYAGGGGSVRGYAFQEAGPIDEQTGNPTGGASVAEVNLETRYKVREKIQIALFADAGSVFESETPDFSGDLLVGAGLGVRYLTPIGPVRIDIATPLNKREIMAEVENDMGVLEEQTVFRDDPIQVYIALGQPF